jgi:pSer/pThr/pTyr-binding forkhead associated (FHA) protein
MEQGPSPGVKFTLAQWPVVIGRAKTATIVIDDMQISRQHARLSQGQEGYVIEDLNSRNGVYLNGQRITAVLPLCSDDQVCLGTSICFRFKVLEAEVVPAPSLVISLANGTTATYTLAEPEISIGRASDNHIVIGSPIVSRYHWRLHRQGNDYLIHVLPSAANPTILAGSPLNDMQPLKDKDELVIGRNVIEHSVILRYESATTVPRDSLAVRITETPAKIVDSSVITRLTKADIEAILKQKNLLVRNLQITQGYHEIALILGHFLGFDHANWFAFGAYASKTAGRAIRHENLPHRLKSALIRSAGYDNTYLYLDHVLANAGGVSQTDNKVSRVLEQVSLLLSLGNLLIFGELAWPFVHMVDRFGRELQPNQAQFTQFIDEHFAPGSFAEGGQEWLRESMNAFYHARFSTHHKAKAELIFFGNTLLALHEQSRLQPVIEKAMAVPFDMFMEGWILGTDKEARGLGKKLADRTAGIPREMIERYVTRMWMSYTLPHREMKVGKNVVAPTGLINFPQDLIDIEDVRCRELIQQFDIGLETLSGSAAGNWGHLKDRMQFIVAFFRSYQSEKRLFLPPFLENQASAIKAGHFPGGKL